MATKLNLTPNKIPARGGNFIVKSASGSSDHVYIRYASDASGSDFSETPSESSNYIGIIKTANEIPSLSASNFSGHWFNWKGAPGNAVNTLLYGPAAPTTEGNDGDFYVRTATNQFYGPKGGGVWPLPVNITGPQGDPGLQGDPGTNGTDGTNGNTLVYGAGVPTTEGNNGDSYIDTTNKKFYPNKTGGVWGSGFDIVGPAGSNGSNGADGKTIIYGSGAPNNGLGNNGDSYYDTTNKTFYANKSAGAWPAGTSLIGPQGTQGAAGSNGTNGKTILYGAGAPSGGTGVDGDSYYDTTNKVFYANKAAGSWGTGASLVGPQGTTGTAGAQGNKSGMIYQYGQSTSNADPSDGKFRLDTASTATPPSPTITVVRLDEKEYGTLNVMDSHIQAIKVNDHLEFRSNDNIGTTFFKVRVSVSPVKVGGSGGYWNVGAVYVSGAIPITNGEIMSVVHVPGPGLSWDGTDLKDSSGTVISNPATYATLADVPAASTMEGKAVIVDSLAGNAGGSPCSIYSKAGANKWSILNGLAIFDKGTPNKRVTAPAATFTGTYSFASAASGAQTKITGAGAHGLVTATVITAGNTYIRIKSGSGANWVPGLYKVTAITLDTTGTDITIDHPYSASFGQPIIALADGNMFEMVRVVMPAMSIVGGAIVTQTFKFLAYNSSTAAKAFAAEIVASGGVIGSGYDIWTQANDTSGTNDNSGRVQFGFNNIDATNVQHRLLAVSDADGWNTTTGTGTDTNTTVGAVQTNVPFNLILKLKLGGANDIGIIRNYLVQGLI